MIFNPKPFLKLARPGDVINIWISPKKDNCFDTLKNKVADFGIQQVQKGVFGRKSDYKDHHSMMYFCPEKTFSVEPPYPKWRDIESFGALGVSIVRWNLIRELNDNDVALLWEGAEKIIKEHKKYDIGQLVDFMISSIAGYPFDDSIKWFDEGKKRMVCSVAVASVIAYWRHKLLATTGEKIRQPFRTLNPTAWKKKFRRRFYQEGHWDINRTFPAMFVNCLTHFINDFRLIAEFDKHGNRIA